MFRTVLDSKIILIRQSTNDNEDCKSLPAGSFQQNLVRQDDTRLMNNQFGAVRNKSSFSFFQNDFCKSNKLVSNFSRRKCRSNQLASDLSKGNWYHYGFALQSNCPRRVTWTFYIRASTSNNFGYKFAYSSNAFRHLIKKNFFVDSYGQLIYKIYRMSQHKCSTFD